MDMIVSTLLIGGALSMVAMWKRKPRKPRKITKKLLSASPNRPVLSWRKHQSLPVQKDPLSLPPSEAFTLKQQRIAVGALGLSGIGTIVHPAFTLAALPLIAYNAFHFMRELRDAWRSKSNLLVTTVDAIGVTTALLLSPFWITALLMLVLLSARRLIARTERQTQADFSRIFGELSNTAWLWKDGAEIEVPLDQLQVNDIIVVHTGEMIAVDGQVVVGEGMLDQHLLTGEFQPVEKKPGDAVFTSTLLLSGSLQIRVEKQGSETITGQIAQTLEHADDFKRQIQSRGDQIVERGAVRTLVTCGVASPFMAPTHLFALSYSGFGYQMRAAAPLMVFNYLRIASKNGILIKDGRALDKLQKVDTVIFDKTGTLTEEIPQIVRIMSCSNITETHLLQYAASIEQRQKHPVGLAICHHAHQQGIALLEIQHREYAIGHGLRAKLIDPEQPEPEQTILIGSRRFIEAANISVPNEIEGLQELAGEQGNSVVYIATHKGKLLGAIELGPVLRPQVQETIATLHQHGIETYIISGDQEKPTRNLAIILGINNYFSETLPEEKARIVSRLQEEGRTVCFMGDGINDSVALQKADVSISLQGAATIAQDTADIVLMEPNLQHLNYLIDISKELHQKMNQSAVMNNAFGVACVSGVMFMGMGIGGAMLLYAGGMVSSLSNAMLPWLGHQRQVTKK